mgnify:CR=1 FL=1
MTKTFAEIIKGIRKAVLGVEVREDIAQGMEYVEQFATTATQKADEAATSASEAKQAKQDTEAAKETAVSAIDTAKSDATTKIETAKSGALTAIGEGKTEGLNALDKKQQEALDAVSGAVNTAQEAAGTATTQAAAATRQATAAASSASAAKASEGNAKTSETESAKNLQGTKEYFEQVRTITIGAQGWYATPDDLKAAVPTGENGWWAVVGTTDTIWTWDSDTGAWKDSVQKADLSDYLTQTQIKKLLENYMPLRAATSTTLGGIKVGNNFSISPDGTISLTGENVTNALTYTPATKDAATQSAAGLMSAADKKKLDSLDSTGSIVASGTNYIRFADGTQICWGTTSTGDEEYIDGWRRVTRFPVAFSSAQYVLLIEQESDALNYWTYKRADLFDPRGGSYGSSVYYLAFGRWK